VQPQPLLLSPSLAADSALPNVFSFPTPEPLLVAGGYTLTAEYNEQRPQLLPALSKDEALVGGLSALEGGGGGLQSAPSRRLGLGRASAWHCGGRRTRGSEEAPRIAAPRR
jgi:hypothetical protein